MTVTFPATIDTNGPSGSLPNNHSTDLITGSIFNDLATLGVLLEQKLGASASTPTPGSFLQGGATPGSSFWGIPVTPIVDVWAAGLITASTTDDTAALNAYLATSGTYILKPKTYTISNSLWIQQSHTRLILLPGAIIRLANSTNQPIIVIGNYGTGSTLIDITIEGGEWDGNAANQSTVGASAWAGHAAQMSGFHGFAFWDVAQINMRDTYIHHTSNSGYQFNKTANVTAFNCRADSCGYISVLQSANHEATNDFSIISTPPNTAYVGGYRLIGCSATNVVDVAFDLHGNSSLDYDLTGSSAIGLCPGVIAAAGGWGFSFEMEQADSVDGGNGVMSGFTADGMTIGIVINNNFNPFLNLDSMVIGPAQLRNCQVAVSMYGQHISLNNVVAKGVGVGITTNNINAWGIASGTATGGSTTTLVNSGAPFPASPALVGYYVSITGGAGNGQIRRVVSHTTNTLTVSPAWTAPASGSTYGVSLNGDWSINGCIMEVNSTASGSSGAYLNVQIGSVIDGVSFNSCMFYGPGANAVISGPLDPFVANRHAGIYTAGALFNLSVTGGGATGFVHGLELGAPYTSQVNGGIYHHNQDAGVRIDNSGGLQLNGVKCLDNAVHSNSGFAAGIELNGGANNIITDCVSGNTPALGGSTGTQLYGINIQGGTGAIISGGDFSNNQNAATLGVTTTTVKSIRNVRGYNDTLASNTPTPTTGAYSITSFRDAQYMVAGGNVNSVTIGGVATPTYIGGSTINYYWVPAGQALVVNNTVIPATFRQILY